MHVRTQPLLKLWKILPFSIKKGAYPILFWGLLAAAFEIVFAVVLSKLATHALAFGGSEITDISSMKNNMRNTLVYVLATSISLLFIRKTFITSTKKSSITIASFVSNSIYSLNRFWACQNIID